LWPVGTEGDEFAVRGETGILIPVEIICELGQLFAFDVAEIEVRLSIGNADEGDEGRNGTVTLTVGGDG
jgi:hypothetical protein